MDFIRRFSDKCPHVNNIFLKLSLKYAENVNHTCFETHNLGFFLSSKHIHNYSF